MIYAERHEAKADDEILDCFQPAPFRLLFVGRIHAEYATKMC